MPGRGAVGLVVWVFTVVMLGGTVPAPLYPFYVRSLELSELQVTVVFAAYAVGTLTALLLGGGVSDRVGRRPVLALAVGIAVASTLVFLLAPTLPGLLVARVLSGLSVGRTTGTATAVTSSSFVAAYLGITVPVVGVGEIATATSLTTAALALAVLVLVLSGAAALLTRRHPTPA